MYTSRRPCPVMLLPILLALGGCDVGVNADVQIQPGSESGGVAVVNGTIEVGSRAHVDGDLSTVNGPVTVGPEAVVNRVSTINGNITLGEAALAQSITTVNGEVTLESQASVAGSVELVQGDVRLESRAQIDGDVESVAGSIRLLDARIGGDVRTVSADVILAGESMIAGGLRIENGKSRGAARPRIIVGPGSMIAGTIFLEEPTEIYVSESGRIGGVEGAMSGDQVVRFKGKEPELQ
ncbi:MAG: hypothetical protein P8172_07550 [Gammaproteobacteria bacterium]